MDTNTRMIPEATGDPVMQRERTAAVMDLKGEMSGFGVLLADPKGHAISVGPSFCRISGLSMQDIEQHALPELIDRISVRAPEVQHRTVRMTSLDGQDAWIAFIVQEAGAFCQPDAQIRHLAFHDPLANLPNLRFLRPYMDGGIANADTAYLAKQEGRNGFRLYASEMNAASFEQMLLEQSLRKAIAGDELLLHYQPQVEPSSGEVVGLEALVRWQHGEFGLIPPSEFIPIAEETGLIVPLGNWVLKQACMQNKKWQEEGRSPIKVSVNVSGKQFQHPEFVAGVAAILDQTEMRPELLELEITESIFIRDAPQTIARLNELKRMGLRIAVDDFGTGYSSMNYLRQFPLDVLKIDRAFIRDIAHNAHDQAITDAMIRLAHDLGLRVVAEGVETAEQLARVKQPRCDAVQGFLFSKPLPAEELSLWLAEAGRRVGA